MLSLFFSPFFFAIYLSFHDKINQFFKSTHDFNTEISDESVSVHIAAPPMDGEANSITFIIFVFRFYFVKPNSFLFLFFNTEELLDYLKTVLNVKKQQLELQRGGKSHNKIVTVFGLNQNSVYSLLSAQINK